MLKKRQTLLFGIDTKKMLLLDVHVFLSQYFIIAVIPGTLTETWKIM
jgi:hypothetical protein